VQNFAVPTAGIHPLLFGITICSTVLMNAYVTKDITSFGKAGFASDGIIPACMAMEVNADPEQSGHNAIEHRSLPHLGRIFGGKPTVPPAGTTVIFVTKWYQALIANAEPSSGY